MHRLGEPGLPRLDLLEAVVEALVALLRAVGASVGALLVDVAFLVRVLLGLGRSARHRGEPGGGDARLT